MYDAVFVLVEAFNKLLQKKPDQFRSYTTRRSQPFNTSSYSTAIAAGGSSGATNNRGLDCNTAKGWVTPWEHGDKISRYLRKVRVNQHIQILIHITTPKKWRDHSCGLWKSCERLFTQIYCCPLWYDKKKLPQKWRNSPKLYIFHNTIAWGFKTWFSCKKNSLVLSGCREFWKSTVSKEKCMKPSSKLIPKKNNWVMVKVKRQL